MILAELTLTRSGFILTRSGLILTESGLILTGFGLEMTEFGMILTELALILPGFGLILTGFGLILTGLLMTGSGSELSLKTGPRKATLYGVYFVIHIPGFETINFRENNERKFKKYISFLFFI